MVGDQTVSIIDGAFLLRPEFAGPWDYVVWLAIDMETMVEERYRRHCIRTHELYQRQTKPGAHAHAVVDNRNLQAPRILHLSLP